MNMNELKLPDVAALVAFGKLGLRLIASRAMSLLALLGCVALSTAVVYSPSWQGAAVAVGAMVFIFLPALKAESKQGIQDAPPQA